MPQTIELLAPAGDERCLEAALSAGADAVYFGLDAGFNARARATNFRIDALDEVMSKIHDRGRRGYITLNTLLFDHELSGLQRVVFAAAQAGVDAAIIQDFGVARLLKQWVPELRLHASTQMTCTDAAGLKWAAHLGMSRVTLARELSLAEAQALAREAPVELEIFVHGALCISYSGQCLTSEAIGGRSANRGACAQACRLPFELIVDGERRELGNRDFLLSPKDLDASSIVPEIVASGVRAIKIEGRLKGAEYVAATTRLYRLAISAAEGVGQVAARDREFSTQFYSRGSSLGFLQGTDHQSLVDGSYSDHIGLDAGIVTGLTKASCNNWIRLTTRCQLSLGDGILIQGRGLSQPEIGGRIWKLRVSERDLKSAEPNQDVWLWLGPDRPVAGDWSGRRVFRTSSGVLDASFQQVAKQTGSMVRIWAQLQGQMGDRPKLTFSTDDHRTTEVELDQPLMPATTTPLTHAAVWEKLARLGDTPYQLTELGMEIPPDSILPLSSLNRARRKAVTQLAELSHRSHHFVEGQVMDPLLEWAPGKPPEAGLFVTCRNQAQAEAALAAGAKGVYLDFLAMTGVGPTMRRLREKFPASIGVALPRVRKPGEAKIDSYLLGLAPDAVLLRSLGSISDVTCSEKGCTPDARRAVFIADFSINVTNTLSAIEILRNGIDAFTPSFDLDTAQLESLLSSSLSAWAEVVVHHAMPLFYMEHCAIAALMSPGRDYRDCGRPCERHVVSLRDRKGIQLPVEADVGCRNTVFHGLAQSGADRVAVLRNAGVTRFRIELVREGAEQTHALVSGYLALLQDRCSAKELRSHLTELGMPVVRGSLRVIG